MSGTVVLARKLWFQVHKWIGISLAILIVPISISGSALVWHDWLDERLNPERRVAAPAAEPAGIEVHARSAAAALAPGERIASIRYAEGEGAVLVSASRQPRAGKPDARPVRTNLWLDPVDGRLLDRAASNEGAVRFLHVLHGSLLVPGVGRQIVGWIGVAMLLSSLTGLWLWWPLRGRWTRGLRWKRQNATSANLHHQVGFWVVIPLAMLSFTGAWISFPRFFGALSGAPAQQQGPSRQSARPLAAPRLSPNEAVEAASSYAAGPLLSVAWPTDKAPQWKIGFAREGGPAEVEVDDASAEATPPKPPRPEPIARTMRRLHDGTGMGPAWQVAIFLGGLAPALLGLTGIIMWLRTRGWRSRIAQRRRQGRRLAAEPAE